MAATTVHVTLPSGLRQWGGRGRGVVTGKAGIHAQVPRKRYVSPLGTPQCGRTRPVSHQDSQPGCPRVGRAWGCGQKSHSRPLTAQHWGLSIRVRLPGAQIAGTCFLPSQSSVPGSPWGSPAEDGLWCPLRPGAREGKGGNTLRWWSCMCCDRGSVKVEAPGRVGCCRRVGPGPRLSPATSWADMLLVEFLPKTVCFRAWCVCGFLR